MLLRELFKNNGVIVSDRFLGMEIDNIAYDSRIASEGSLFVCIVGSVTDGHKYAALAYERGCRAFLAEHQLDLPDDAAVITVRDTRTALANVSAEFYGHPSDKLAVIGVTGTKGKTTTSLLIHSILNDSGISTGYIGSAGVIFAGRHTSTLRTTPESADLQLYFSKMVSAGVKAVVMEVSSQAVLLDRIHGITFDTCVYTNLSPDHIGPHEHPDFENYRDCKARLFSDYGCRYIVYNEDDENHTYMISGTSALLSSVSMKNKNADYFGGSHEKWRDLGALGVDFMLHSGDTERKIRLRSPGSFSVYNALEAIAVCRRFGVSWDIIADSLSKASPIGRFEVVDVLPYCTFIIDFAHNELSLRSSLSVLREYAPSRLCVVVGSVGGRTFSRRAPIGKAISECADFCILTADDPDFEDPMDIIHDILTGFEDRETPYICIPDRREALRYAVENARPGDIILLAGKGHEKFQLICGEHQPFSEKSIVTEAAEALKSGANT